MSEISLTNNDDLKLFRTCCPEMFEENDVDIFRKFFCPISIIEADVKEYIVDEYDSVELLVLRLCSAGIRDINIINELTGIDIHMLDKVLKTEIYTYGHINPNTGERTEAGKQTLEDNKDIEKLFQHALYDVKREIQADSLTGTIIRAEAEQPKEKMVTFSDRINPNILPLEAVVIDSELEKEITERLQMYIKEGYLTDGNTINEIGNLRSKEIRYRAAFFVKMRKFEYPFIAISYFEKKEEKWEKYIIPIAIAKSDSIKFDYPKRNKEYLVREDRYFEYLLEKKELFDNEVKLTEDAIREIILSNDYNDSNDSIIDESRDVVNG